jgi:site-specific DNA-methyltransferase (adenine-specific)
MSKTNEASGVINAASRKYFTPDHLWYFPPAEAFEKIAAYANKHGRSSQKPYFSINGKVPTKIEWSRMRAKFYCPTGVTNVWNEPPVNGHERLKNGNKAVHINQKPLKLMRLLISSTSDKGDVVWEPFGGLCSGAIAASDLGRIAYTAEINAPFFEAATERIKNYKQKIKLNL